jgi:hypothetical protein
MLVGWKVITTFHLLPIAGTPGSNQLSPKCRTNPGLACAAGSESVHGMRRSVFSEEDWRIFILRRSLLTFCSTCVLDECKLECKLYLLNLGTTSTLYQLYRVGLAGQCYGVTVLLVNKNLFISESCSILVLKTVMVIPCHAEAKKRW